VNGQPGNELSEMRATPEKTMINRVRQEARHRDTEAAQREHTKGMEPAVKVRPGQIWSTNDVKDARRPYKVICRRCFRAFWWRFSKRRGWHTSKDACRCYR